MSRTFCTPTRWVRSSKAGSEEMAAAFGTASGPLFSFGSLNSQ